MNVINVNTKQHERVILLNINSEGVRYECDQCEYKATDKDNPRKHKKFKHEGVSCECRYECDKCERKFT